MLLFNEKTIKFFQNKKQNQIELIKFKCRLADFSLSKVEFGPTYKSSQNSFHIESR